MRKIKLLFLIIFFILFIFNLAFFIDLFKTNAKLKKNNN